MTSNRFFQALLYVSIVGCSWLGMQAVHELGHVLAARASGGRVSQLVIELWGFSRTELSVNPHPLFVVWGGPLLGAALPVAGWGCMYWLVPRQAYLVRFLAGFCLITNGAHLGGGAFTRAGDAGDLLRRGAAFWQLEVFGVATAADGLWLWQGLGPAFGIGATAQPVDRRTAIGMGLLLLTLIVLLELR